MDWTELSGAELVGLLRLAGGSEIDEMLAGAGDRGGEDEFSLSGDEDELAGAEIDELLATAGARRRKGALSRLTRPAASLANRVRASILAQKMAQTQVLARERPASRGGDVLLPFGPVVVLGFGIATIPATPQEPFRPERLVVPSDVAGQFGILQFLVGKFPLYAAAGEAPARAFAENAVGVRLGMYTAQVGNIVTLQVRNKSAGPLEFSAALIGPAIE